MQRPFSAWSALALSNQFDEAAEAYRKAIRVAPHVAAAHCGLADVLFRLRKFKEAEQEYRHALMLQPNLFPALHSLSRLTFEKGDALQALELSVRLLASDESEDSRCLFVDCSRAGWLPKPIAGLTQTLVRAIKRGWLRPYGVMGLAGRALELDPIVGKCIERAGATPHGLVPDADLFSEEEITALESAAYLGARIHASREPRARKVCYKRACHNAGTTDMPRPVSSSRPRYWHILCCPLQDGTSQPNS